MVWTIENSPYEGRELLVHLMIADRVPDPDERTGALFYMGIDNIARKARTTDRTAQATIRKLVEDGFLALIEDNKNRPKVYEFLMPDVPAVWTPPARISPEATSPSAPKPLHPGAKSLHREGEATSPDPQETQVNAQVDALPVVADAPTPRQVMDSRIKHITDKVWQGFRDRGDPPPANFLAVKAVLKKVLAAGWLDDDLVEACLAVPTISTGTLEYHLRGTGRSKAQSRDDANMAAARDFLEGRGSPGGLAEPHREIYP